MDQVLSQEAHQLPIGDQTGESRVYVLPRKAAEERQRFDKAQTLSFLPPEMRAAGIIVPRGFKLYHHLLFHLRLHRDMLRAVSSLREAAHNCGRLCTNSLPWRPFWRCFCRASLHWRKRFLPPICRRVATRPSAPYTIVRGAISKKTRATATQCTSLDKMIARCGRATPRRIRP